MRRHATVLVVFLGCLLAGFALAADDPTATVYDAHSAFEAIKSMEGTWVGTVTRGEDGEPRETKIVYDVSANGHSVIETFSPGSPMEMFSVYHMDGDKLLMTHYCALGNAPKMKLVPSETPGELAFAFNGGTNLDPEVDPHAHEGTMKILGPDEVSTVAVGYSGGEPGLTQYFSMKRQP